MGKAHNRLSHCKLWTQEPENFDEEVKSLVTAWLMLTTSSSTSSRMCPLIIGLKLQIIGLEENTLETKIPVLHVKPEEKTDYA